MKKVKDNNPLRFSLSLALACVCLIMLCVAATKLADPGSYLAQVVFGLSLIATASLAKALRNESDQDGLHSI